MKSDDGDSSVALMFVDNIDNLECTLSGAGTSHHVNFNLVKKQTQAENQAINEQEELQSQSMSQSMSQVTTSRGN